MVRHFLLGYLAFQYFRVVIPLSFCGTTSKVAQKNPIRRLISPYFQIVLTFLETRVELQKEPKRLQIGGRSGSFRYTAPHLAESDNH